MQGAPTLAGGSRHEHKLLQKVAARNNIMFAHAHALQSSVAGGKKIALCADRPSLTHTTRRTRQPASNNNARLNPKLSSLFFFLMKFKHIQIQILVRYLVMKYVHLGFQLDVNALYSFGFIIIFNSIVFL
jgi:hypothetical protein